MGNAISSPRPKQTTFDRLTVGLLNLTSCETVDLCLVVRLGSVAWAEGDVFTDDDGNQRTIQGVSE